MSRWKQHIFAAPGMAVSLLPTFACPLCASASIGVLSSFGFGYLLSRAYLLPITAALLAITLAALAWRAQKRNGYGPFLVGAMAAATVLLSKFKWDSVTTNYVGVGLLVISSVWNAWPRRSATEGCPACNQENQ